MMVYLEKENSQADLSLECFLLTIPLELPMLRTRILSPFVVPQKLQKIGL
jgi:hypothetical protein